MLQHGGEEEPHGNCGWLTEPATDYLIVFRCIYVKQDLLCVHVYREVARVLALGLVATCSWSDSDVSCCPDKLLVGIYS